jgi:hypothetical protein
MLIFPVAPSSHPHAAMTIASFTATETISSMPVALMAPACCTNGADVRGNHPRVLGKGGALLGGGSGVGLSTRLIHRALVDDLAIIHV